jgi:MraZ protein
VFRGQFQHAIDAKGRVSLPSRFRDVLLATGDPRLIITPSVFDSCLHLYSLRQWEVQEEKIAALPSLNPTIVRFRRLYVSPAMECEVDGSGRVQIPSELRTRVKLEREVLLAGMGTIIELWSKDLWDQALASTPEEDARFRTAVQELVAI